MGFSSVYAGISLDENNFLTGVPCPLGQKYESYIRNSSGGAQFKAMRCVQDDTFWLKIVGVIFAITTVGVVITIIIRRKRRKKNPNGRQRNGR
jgi:hypothetical protein